MRLGKPLLLTFTASVGLAALIVWLTGDGRGTTTSQGTEEVLSALFAAEDRQSLATDASKNRESDQLSKTVPAVPPPVPTADPQLRIALLNRRPLLRVTMRGGADCRSEGGRPVDPEAVQSMLAGSATGFVSCGGDGGSVLVNGHAYAGTVHLLNRGQGWLAINQIALESYVASVVGAEMPSYWNQEALKAQAVAARSYALVHMLRPADRDWNLGDTTRWQAYSGRTSTTESTIKAAETTRGIVLSFKGGLVESLYAATQEISDEAHGHLGASMSQHGAQRLANRGLLFNEILGRYYSGASLARIRTDGQ